MAGLGRVDKLRGFWEEISAPAMGFHAEVVGLFERGKAARAYANQVNAAMVACAGAPGFFRPRIPNPWFYPPGTIEATSYYNTRWLKATLERFVDFDRVNANKKETRLSRRRLGVHRKRAGRRLAADREINPRRRIPVPSFSAVAPTYNVWWLC